MTTRDETPDKDDAQDTPSGEILQPMMQPDERDREHETLEDLEKEIEQRKTD